MSFEQEEFETRMTMTDCEADWATLDDMRRHMGGFALFIDMVRRGGEI